MSRGNFTGYNVTSDRYPRNELMRRRYQRPSCGNHLKGNNPIGERMSVEISLENPAKSACGDKRLYL